MNKIYQTDWLASQPIFYNEKTGEISNNINHVIDFRNLEFHPEGFNNYLDFGYSILEQTPVKNVKFLRHSSKLIKDESNNIKVEYLDDPVDNWLGKVLHEDDVWHLLETSVRDWEKNTDGEIIIPTSGGYDSRILNFFIENKSRVRAFTYGISPNQAQSFEVVYANRLCEILGIKWEQIILGDYHKYFEEWDSFFGISTHAHGMYHIEFYHKILSKLAGNFPFLSGAIGDAWAGSVKIAPINHHDKIINLSYSHGLQANSRYSNFQSSQEIIKKYFDSKKEKLQDPFFQVIESMRFKIILLSYLVKIPQSFGFQVFAPFLNINLALSMMRISHERRHKRLWQTEFFQKQGIDLESMNLKIDCQNNLNHQAMRSLPLTPLDVNLLREVVSSQYVEWINKYIHPKLLLWDLFWSIRKVPKLRFFIYRAEIQDQRLKAYHAYLTLKPIENLLRKRNAIL